MHQRHNDKEEVSRRNEWEKLWVWRYGWTDGDERDFTFYGSLPQHYTTTGMPCFSIQSASRIPQEPDQEDGNIDRILQYLQILIPWLQEFRQPCCRQDVIGRRREVKFRWCCASQQNGLASTLLYHVVHVFLLLNSPANRTRFSCFSTSRIPVQETGQFSNCRDSELSQLRAR